jgi:hypothetical protein
MHLIAHPQDAHAYVVYCGLVRHLHDSAPSECVLFVDTRFEKLAIRMYSDIMARDEPAPAPVDDDANVMVSAPGRLIVYPVENMNTVTLMNAVTRHFRKVTTRHFFGEQYDKLRFNDKFKGLAEIHAPIQDPYAFYGYDTSLMWRRFSVPRRLELENDMLNNVRMVANTNYALFSSTENVRRELRCAYTISISMQTMFGEAKLFDLRSFLEVCGAVFLIPEDIHTLVVMLMDLHDQENGVEDARVKRTRKLLCRTDPTTTPWYIQHASSNWKKIEDAYIIEEELEEAEEV